MTSFSEWMPWINSFFSELEIFEDNERKTNHRIMLRDKIINFIGCPNEKTSEEVYKSFFIAYWFGDEDDNPFLELVKKVYQFEKTSGSLLSNHRDHFSHAVYVFITGLVIYWNSSRYRNHFDSYIYRTKYADSYKTKHEEFFYRWGIASLFHDIAYPLEISIKQLNTYFDYTLSYGQKPSLNNIVNISEFNKYKTCLSQRIDPRYEQELKQKYGDLNNLLENDCCRLLARDIGQDFYLDNELLFSAITTYDNNVSNGTVDHGFFGSLICLKWYSTLIDNEAWNPAYLHYPVLDAASAVFLHNAYKYLLQKNFAVPPMNISQKPISYLLILADHLQEWNREILSEECQQKTVVSDFRVDFRNESFFAQYVVKDGRDFNCCALENELKSILEFNDLFLEFGMSVKKGQDG